MSGNRQSDAASLPPVAIDVEKILSQGEAVSRAVSIVLDQATQRNRLVFIQKGGVSASPETAAPSVFTLDAEAVSRPTIIYTISGKTLEIPEEQMESLYALAYASYQQGDYTKAADCFRYLLYFDTHSYRYLLGLAACLHKQEEYESASNMYLAAAAHCPRDPVPLFHGAGDKRS